MGKYSFYKQNIRLLEEYQPKVWQLMRSEIEPAGTIVPAENGSPNLVVSGADGREFTMHQNSSPEIEADDFLANLPEGHTGFAALLGMGLGYAAVSILTQRPLLQYFAVFEHDIAIFKRALMTMDLSSLLQDKRLILWVGEAASMGDILAPAARTLQLEGSRVLHHLPSFELYPKAYQRLKEALFEHLNSMNLGGTTTMTLGRGFFTNRFKHITTIHHHLLLEHLADAFKGVPAILVAGGPSLDKNIHLLKEVRGRAVIVAVDTVLPALIKHGVKPHFVTCIDANNLTYEKMADVIPEVRETSLICSSWVNPRTAHNFPSGPVLWTFTGQPMEAWLNTQLGGRICTGGASTVAHLNLVATDILGCEPIIMIGQDLAYPKEASHAQDTVLQGSAPAALPDNANTEGQLVKGIDGSMLRTNRSFLDMKSFFESVIANSKKKFINATEGGAHIEGTKVMTLREVLAKLGRGQGRVRETIKAQISTAPPLDPAALLVEFRLVAKKIKVLLRYVTEADKLCLAVRREVSALARKRGQPRSFNDLQGKTQQKISKIDALHKKLDNAVMIWRILEEITMDALQQSERERQAISVLENDPAQYAEWLRQNLARLRRINEGRRRSLDLLGGEIAATLAFHKEEKHLLPSAADKNEAADKVRLARFYVEREYYALAYPLLKNLPPAEAGSAEALFALGCVKTMRTEFTEAESCFLEAVRQEPLLAAEIKKFHRRLADDFLEYARYFRRAGNRRQSVIYMLKKGLAVVPDHDHLTAELSQVIQEDMNIFGQMITGGDIDGAAAYIDPWFDYGRERPELTAGLPVPLQAALYYNHGRLYAVRGEKERAAPDYAAALELTPEDCILHRALIDTLFAIGDFPGAITALEAAIKVNADFSSYWETIGDKLCADEQYDDAVLAYERCLIMRPEQLNLLKKIGDCYMAADQLEAARQAYSHLKMKLEAVA